MIEIQDLFKTFKLSRKQRKEIGTEHEGGLAHAVAGISLTCRPGRIFSLPGPHGAGKTTALRMNATLLKPSSGSIKVCGYDTQSDPIEVRKRIGFLTGSTKLYDRLTPIEVVKFFADVYDVDKATFERRVDELFTTLDMHDFANKRIGKLSTGMTQKVSIVRTMIHDPDVLVSGFVTIGSLYLGTQFLDKGSGEINKAVNSLLEPTTIIAVIALLLPVTAFFAAIALAISVYCKSFKEAQSLLAPLIMVAILPLGASMLPGIELTAKTALIPILNVSLSIKAIIAGTAQKFHLFLVYGSLTGIALVSLYLCSKMFNRESAVFRN